GISRVSADGGQPSVVVKPSAARTEVFYGPELLPDRQTLLFTVDTQNGGTTATSRPWDNAQIVIQNLASERRTVIVQGGTHARFVSTGHVLFARQETLWAVRFDPRTDTRTGNPVAMVQGIRQTGTTGGLNTGGNVGSAQFAVSASGLLAYVEAERF